MHCFALLSKKVAKQKTVCGSDAGEVLRCPTGPAMCMLRVAFKKGCKTKTVCGVDASEILCFRLATGHRGLALLCFGKRLQNQNGV